MEKGWLKMKEIYTTKLKNSGKTFQSTRANCDKVPLTARELEKKTMRT